MKEIIILFDGLDTDNRVKFKELFSARYIEVMLWLNKKEPVDDFVDVLAEMYLAGLLSEPNDVTHYAYETEVYRKRDRAIEAVNSVTGRILKQIEIDKAIRFWSQMSQQYADIVSDGATMEAFRAAGVKKVKWNTQRDGKVCPACKALDGEIFSIKNAPPKQHWRDRCWLSPVIE